MKASINRRLVLFLTALFSTAGFTLAQNPGLPFEGPDGPGPERLGQNSFGRGTALRSIHNESIPNPDIGDPADFLPPPTLPPIPRIYLTIRYYGCRPWLINPYTGGTLLPEQILRSVQTDCPNWPGVGRPIEELVKDDPQLGEPLVQVIDEGIVDENNPNACRDFELEQESEIQNAAQLGVTLRPTIQPIVHAPYYGLYCLRIRICIPVANWNPGQVWHYWVRWPYRPVQPWCWSTWYWHRWQTHRTFGNVVYPWRPLCSPHTWWVRSGPDWVFNCVNVTPFRHWCLYGLRYHCYYWVNPIVINPVLPRIADLRDDIEPDVIDPEGLYTTRWLRPWPYPVVRYWPFKPYCTRWFWFRPLPWFRYRYLPPVLQGGVASANDVNGGGFVDGVNPQQFAAPLDPPVIGPDGRYIIRGGLPGGPKGAAPDSFFDIFLDVGECRWRPVEERLADLDGNGSTSNADRPRNLLSETIHTAPDDLTDADFRIFQP